MRLSKQHLIVAVPLSALAIGAVLIAASIVYDALAVGVPTQDPNPEIANHETFHSEADYGLFIVSVCITTLGLVFSLLGGMFLAFARFFDRRVRSQSEPRTPSPQNRG